MFKVTKSLKSDLLLFVIAYKYICVYILKRESSTLINNISATIFLIVYPHWHTFIHVQTHTCSSIRIIHIYIHTYRRMLQVRLIVNEYLI